jgi:hypothetical protein
VPRALDDDWREEDGAHYGRPVLRDERQGFRTGFPQSVDEVGLRRLSERQLVDASHLRTVVGSLGSDG